MNHVRPELHRRIERLLREVERPARYMGGEHNSAVKDHAAVRARVVMAFPDSYEIGMSHLGLRILYDVMNRRADMLLERCFAPWPDMERALRENEVPLFSLETRTPLAEFDVIGVSLQYELSFTNILLMLDLAGLPLRSAERDASHPLVVAGGPVAFSPEPVADFIDAFVIGDGEESFPALALAHAASRERGESRARALRAICRIPGVYVPALYDLAPDPRTGLLAVRPKPEFARQAAAGRAPAPPACAAGVTWSGFKGRAAGESAAPAPEPLLAEDGLPLPPFPIRRAVLDDLNRFPFPADTIVPHPEIVHDRVSVEIARGCTEGCRFCQAGYIYRPVRERSAESIVESALCGLKSTGYDEVNLTSLSPADYSALPRLVETVMDTLAESQVGLAVSSLRPYGLTEGLAKQISRVTRTGFTIAPDAGTQRLRDVLNKGITEEHILSAARNAFREGWALIKLYFIIGLPTETEEDLEGMVDLARRIWEIGREELGERNAGGRGRVFPRIHFSASSLVPKPHTPFQWLAQETVESLYRKERFIASRVGNRHIRFKHHHVETSRLETLLSRGDRRVGAAIERAYQLGCRFDGWTEHLKYDAWCQAMEEEGLSWEPYLGDLPLESTLPWDHVDTTVEKAFLVREWQRALRGALTPACEKPYRKFTRPYRENDKLVCYDCGCDCDLDHIRDLRLENQRRLEAMTGLERPMGPPPAEGPRFRYRLVFEKGGAARHLAHLDILRAFTRAFRRAEIPARVTQGFNPRPLFSFGPALALGFEGREEAFEFWLGAPADTAALVARLNVTMPGGLRVREILSVAADEPSLGSQVRELHYRVSVPLDARPARAVATAGRSSVDSMPFNEESGLRDTARGEARGSGRGEEPGEEEARLQEVPVGRLLVPDAPDAAWHRDRVEAYNRAPVCAVTRTRRGRAVELDLKTLVRRVELVAGGEDAAPDEIVLRFTATGGERGSVRPEELLRGIYGYLPHGTRVVRERIVLEPGAAIAAA